MKKMLVIVAAALLLVSCGTAKNSESLQPGAGAEFGERDYEGIISANNALGLNVMADLTATEGGNIVLSPLSLFMALSMVHNGADGVTREEIAEVLGSGDLSADELNRANASLLAHLAASGEGIEVRIANSIWANEDYELLEPFETGSADYYNALIEPVDITDPDAAERIDDWVSEATNDKITKMAPETMPGNLVAMLLNAVYFNGDWQVPFEESATEQRPFHFADGSTVKVPLMRDSNEFSYLETDGFQAVALPYGDGAMSMYVFLPAEDSSLADFRSTLTAEALADWRSSFTFESGTVRLPKFTLETDMPLNGTLQRLGMQTAFEQADFSNMFASGAGFHISEVKQKTFINVNEQGTEAAAATSVAVDSSGPADPFDMTVDRPFFFAITDETSGAVLFMGAIENPVE